MLVTPSRSRDDQQYVVQDKIMLIVAAGLAGLIVIVGIALFTLRGQMFSERQAQTLHLIEAATTLIDHYAVDRPQWLFCKNGGAKGAVAVFPGY